MSEHKTGHSNWTPEQKKLYQERRERGLRGTAGYVKMHSTVKDEEGKDQLIPRSGSAPRSMRSMLGRRQMERRQLKESKAKKKREVKATSRGN